MTSPGTKAHSVFKAQRRTGMTKHIRHKPCMVQGHSTNKGLKAGNGKTGFISLALSSHNPRIAQINNLPVVLLETTIIPHLWGHSELVPTGPTLPKAVILDKPGAYHCSCNREVWLGFWNSFQEDISCLEMLSQALVLGIPVPRQRPGTHEGLGLGAWRRLFWTDPNHPHLPYPLPCLHCLLLWWNALIKLLQGEGSFM